MELLRNRHFNNVTAVLRVAHTSQLWLERYADHRIGIDLSTDTLDKKSRSEYEQSIKATLVETLTRIASLDPRLALKEDDYEWLQRQNLTTLQIVISTSKLPCETLTMNQVSKITGKCESGWRRKASLIPMAQRRGATWLLPVPVLCLMNMLPIEFESQLIRHKGFDAIVSVSHVGYYNDDSRPDGVIIKGRAYTPSYKLELQTKDPFKKWEIVEEVPCQ